MDGKGEDSVPISLVAETKRMISKGRSLEDVNQDNLASSPSQPLMTAAPSNKDAWSLKTSLSLLDLPAHSETLSPNSRKSISFLRGFISQLMLTVARYSRYFLSLKVPTEPLPKHHLERPAVNSSWYKRATPGPVGHPVS